jgi:hypothetical protein
MTRRRAPRDLGWVGKASLVVAVAVVVGWAASRPQAAVTRNRLAQNRLAQNRLAQNRLAQNRLAQNALSSTRLEATLATTELLATADGREVYSYIISCALPEGVTMEAAVPGAPDIAPPHTLYTCKDGKCVFSGSLGLAPYWVDRPLPPKGQRWVTACLLARVNLHDTTEAISLRGVAPELTVSVDEAELYNVEEGAFFGNLFADGDEIDWNACRGEGQASGEFGGLNLRDCAEEDPSNRGFTYCGFKYAGNCADFTPEFPGPYACKSFEAEEGTYSDCHATEGNGQWPGSRPYREVITVYVTGE